MSAPNMRLDRLLANLGYGSRKQVQQLVRYGAVMLDGVTIKAADIKVPVAPDLPTRMQVEGEPVDPPPGLVLMLHKPVGVTCSHKEAGELVYDLLPFRWRHRDPPISSVGRLDKETSGLLLLTDDGTLLHRIISPKSSVTKRYRVVLDRALRGNEAEILASGTLMLEGEDKPLLPVGMEKIGDTEVFVTLTEGRYHQVRRMFAAMANHVIALHRDRVGALELRADLAEREFCILSETELAKVFENG